MKKISPDSIPGLASLCLLFILLFLYGDHGPFSQTDRKTNVSESVRPVPSPRIITKIPDYFEANLGQTHETVKFLSKGRSHTLFLTPSGAVLSLTGTKEKEEKAVPSGEKPLPETEHAQISLLLEGSNPAPEIEGINKLPGVSNYLKGNDPGKWRRNVPHYAMVKYSDVYEGIDLVYHTRQGNLEYDFIVASGADPGKIRLRIEGSEMLKKDASGNLELQTSLGDLLIKAPVTYQEVGKEKKYIASDYEIEGDLISIRLDSYDRTRPLIIDPELAFSTYLGGSATEGGYGIDTDNDGNVYVIGSTTSADFPGFDGSSLAGETDVFVTKLNTLTSELIFTTILGGKYSEKGLYIGIDDSKNILAAGETCSGDFPVKNAIQQELGDVEAGTYDFGDIFAFKLDPTGSSLLYSTYLGGKEDEWLHDAVFDESGNTFLSGTTDFYLEESDCVNHFPQYPKIYREDICFYTHFVVNINADGDLQYSTLFEGTSANDNCLAVNQAGNACLLRWSPSGINYLPWELVSIVELNSTGSGIVDSVAFMMAPEENPGTWINDFQLDEEGNIYLAGDTQGDLVPATSDGFQSTYNYVDGFIYKLKPDASEFLYATYFGGAGYDYANNIQIDKNGNILVYGRTQSDDFPTRKAYQSEFGGGSDTYLAMIDPSKKGDSSLVFSTYFGGESTDIDMGFVVDANDDIYLTGYTWSTEFPVEKPHTGTLAGTTSAFVSVFAPNLPIDLIYDEVVIAGWPIFTQLLPPFTQQVLPQYLIRTEHDTVLFRFAGRSTDGRVGLRVANTLVNIEPPLTLDMAVFDPDEAEIATWTIFNLGEGNRGVQFDVTRNGFYTVKVWAEPESHKFPAPFQIHLSGNVGWPQPLLYPIPDPPPNGYPDDIRATRQDILINNTAPRPQLLRGSLGDVLFDPDAEVAQTSLFKFTNIFQVSEHAVAVLAPFNKMGFEPGRAPVRMPDPNPMPDITTPTAPFNSTAFFPGGGYVVDFTQVPIPAAINVPVQLRMAAVLGKEDGISAEIPVIIPGRNFRLTPTYTIILDMGSGQEIVDGEGNDFLVYSPDGDYRVAVSNTIFDHSFIPIGEIFSGDQEFDLNVTSLTTVRYIRIIAEPLAYIDAVRAINYFCDEVRNDIGPVSKVSYVTLTARRSKAPQTPLDPLMEFIGPDGALNATNESGFGDDLSLNQSDAAFINMELNEEGFYRYLVRGYDKTPDAESFGTFYTRYESAGSYDATEIIISESELTDITAQRKISTTNKRQRDSYLFQAAPNQIVNIAVYSSEIDVMLELFDPEEFLIDACDNHVGWGTDALISVQLPDSSFMGQSPLPALNTYRVVVSAMDQPGTKKSTQEGSAYIRQPAIGEYEVKVTTSDELVGLNDRKTGDLLALDNYPNPFSQYTEIRYDLYSAAYVSVEIYDLKGDMVLSLVNETKTAGSHYVYWYGNDRYGHRIPNGVYICRMRAGKNLVSKKITFNR